VSDASTEALLGEIVDEFLERLGRGERPEAEEYAHRFPRLATMLRQMLPALQVLHTSMVDHPRTAGGTEIEPEGPLGDFRIVREVGRGGMGVVYEAVQISLGRRVALKVLPFAATLDARQLQRFKNEAQAAAHLHHQNIVPVYAVGVERGVHYYAMQFIEGQTLAALIGELRNLAGLQPPGQGGPRRPPSEVVSRFASGQWLAVPATAEDGQKSAPAVADTARPSAAALTTAPSTRNPTYFRTVASLAMQAADALVHAHRHGVVHRDVKPANLLVDAQGNLWMTDFGLARVQSDTQLTLTGDLVGTLRYMSPEQALAQPHGVDHRTDLYSLGATLYELLTLTPAFDGRDRQALLRQIAFDEPLPPRRINKAVPADLETIVLKAMAKNPLERYAAAEELADDLERFLKDEPIRARRQTLVQRARKWVRRHRPVVWTAVTGLFVALAILAGSLGWVVRDRVARRAKTAGDIQAALEDGHRFERDGKWPEAQAAAGRAEVLLATGGGSEELQRGVQELLADLQMIARLEDVRIQGSLVANGHFDSEREDRGYAAAFRDYGLDVETLDHREAAHRIGARTIQVELAAALDRWAQTRRWFPQKGRKSWKDLLAVARAADPDPTRRELRDALLRADRQVLLQQAACKDLRALPPVTVVLLAEFLAEMGDQPEATALLRRAQEQYPGDFWINHQLAFSLGNEGTSHQDETIRFYTAAVALRPESLGARLNLGNALARKGRLDEALAVNRRAIDLKPDYAEAYCNVGNILADKGQLDKARAAYRQAIELKPSLPQAHFNLGLTFQKQGRLDEAVAAYRSAIDVKPGYAEAHCNLASLLVAKGMFDEAVAACRKALDLKRDFPEAYFNLGLALTGKGRLDEALAAYRQAINLRPSYAEAHCNLGNILCDKGLLDDALAAYRRAIALKPNLAMAHFNLGRTLEQTGRPTEAVLAYRRAIDLKPDWAEAHYDLGNAHREEGLLDEAVAAYRRAIELKPDYAEAYCNLGITLRKQGKFDRAVAALQRGHDLGSQRLDWFYPSARWVEEAQQLGALAEHLPAFLRGEAQPANAAERDAYALFCYDKRRFATAARLWASALTADPKQADDLEGGYRHDAARAAARAGCGQRQDADPIDDEEQARWRKQALAWLRADLRAYGKLLESGQARDRQRVRQRLLGWQGDPSLAGLRVPAALARLPADEQQACKQLWAEVQAFLAKADAAE
jgi:tetratricopeptide (TPR) repeat protein